MTPGARTPAPRIPGPARGRRTSTRSSSGWFLSIWGPSGSDLYAVGGSPDAGLIMHFDGTDWSNLPIGIDVPLLNWVYGFGANDITFVGAGGTVLHYDGTTFTAQPTPTDQDLWGVWGAAPDDLWTVGGNGRQEDQATILHFDGTAWTEATLPPIQRASVGAFFKVWGSARDDVYAVGQRGIVMHFDGSAWEELFVGASDDLISVWGTGPDRVVMVGGRANGQIVTYDGTDFRHMSLSPSPRAQRRVDEDARPGPRRRRSRLRRDGGLRNTRGDRGDRRLLFGPARAVWRLERDSSCGRRELERHRSSAPRIGFETNAGGRGVSLRWR